MSATFKPSSAAAGHVAPGGLLFVSTIDRTWKRWLFAIVGAEYVFRVLPRGTSVNYITAFARRECACP